MSITIAKLHRASGTRFKAILRDGSGRALRSKTFTRLSLAREWGRRVASDRELVAALGTECARLTLADLVRGDPPRRPAFVVPEQRRWQVDWWLARLGGQYLTDITPDAIRTALAEYAAGNVMVFIRGQGPKDSGRRRSPASANRLRAMLAALYRHARVAWGLTVDSPLRAVPPLQEKNQRKRFLSEEEVGRLLEAAKASSWPKLHLLVLLALTTGARRGELAGLRWPDIDFDARTAILHDSKNGDPRLLTIPPLVMAELAKLRELGDTLVFARPGAPYTPFDFRAAWWTALEAAGIERWKPADRADQGFRFHDLRHSTASFLAANGASLFQIGEVLGHRSSATTKRYSHLMTTAKRQFTDQVFGGLLDRTTCSGAGT